METNNTYLEGLPLEATPQMLVPALRTAFSKLSTLILELSAEIAKTNKVLTTVGDEHGRKINISDETLKDFGARLDAIKNRVDEVHASNSVISACGPVILNVESVEDLESKISKKLSAGDYRIRFGELSGLHLYVGDEYSLLYYPDFYDLGIVYSCVNHMRCSKYNIEKRRWENE